MKRFVFAEVFLVIIIDIACGYDEYVIASGNKEPCCADIVNPPGDSKLVCPKVVGHELYTCPQPCSNECTKDTDCKGSKVCCCRCGNKCLDGVEPSRNEDH